ncbi:serine/threonine-protein kinase [Streptomyces sp. SPB162]|nr:serine/threonine-protein kinase [Streptomyces sp. SPB162]
MVHRDLKPANVLLATTYGDDGSPHMHPMLTDFGIARLADSPGITRTHEFVGTPAYVAPESAQGKPQTSAVDLYGAGILLYELVTGRAPFRGDNALEVLHAHLSQDPVRPGNVPEPLWTVIERCLRKNPEERPSAENLARALRVAAAGIGVHATPAEAEAALGVAALLGPDLAPTTVPGSADPTQVLPSHRYDPNGATGVLPLTGPAGPGADGTRVMPPVPDGPPQGAPDQQGPHPWQSQLSAARRRGEQTELQYLDPEQDPLRRRPRRQPGGQQQGQQGQYQQGQQGQNQYQQGQGQYQQGQGQQGQGQQGYAPQQPSRPQPRYQQQPQQPQQQAQPRYQQPQPQRYEPQRPPEPQPRREPRPRGANPMKIPGLGCLKGCLTSILVLIVIFVVVWYTTPLPEWVDSGQNLWDTTTGWISTAWDKVNEVAGSGN